MPYANKIDAKNERYVDKALSVGNILKFIGGTMFGVLTIVISVIFWVQTQGEGKYYPKLAGENLAEQMSKIEHQINQIQQQNIVIIGTLGRIEGATNAQKAQPAPKKL